MNIYFSGSIYGGRQKLETYKTLIEKLKEYGNVLNEQVGSDTVLLDEKNSSDENIFSDLESKMLQADIIFAEVTIPSLGVGYELGFADSHNKKIIGIYDKTVTEKVTTMLRGNKRIKLIPYDNIDEIITNIGNIIKGEEWWQ